MLDPATVFTIAKAALPTLIKSIVERVDRQLNPTELERILQKAIATTLEYNSNDSSLPPNQWLFYHIDERQAGKFLQRVLEHHEVQEELEKPFKKEEAPDQDLLIEKTFKQVKLDKQ